jgi:hypothetical protein
MIQALAWVSSSHFAELFVLAAPEVSKAIYRQEKLTPCRVFNTNRQKTNDQMDYCWLCPPVQAVLPLAVFATRWRWDIAIIHMNWGPCKV